MSVAQPRKDTPFGLEPNVAAGLAYLFPIVGGMVMLVAGSANRFVRWAIAQSITVWVAGIVLYWLLGMAMIMAHSWLGFQPVGVGLRLIALLLWVWTFVTAFWNKEVQVPVAADLTRNLFKTYVA